MKKLLFIWAVLALMLTACNTGPQNEEPVDQEVSIKEYYPATENTKYTYQGEGNEFASYTMFFDYISDEEAEQTREVPRVGVIYAMLYQTD